MSLLAALALGAAPAPVAKAAPVDPQAILAGAPDRAWRDIPANELMIWTFEGGQRVIARLAPDFAPVHIANLKAMARGGYWKSARIHRVQDNFVAQWGIDEDPVALPAGAVKIPPAEYERPLAGLSFTPMLQPDPFAPRIGFANGWPVSVRGGKAAIAHCYGIVGVARDDAPDTGSGGDLYAIIGQPPRRIDRALAVVGQVVEGMEYLASRPRGPMSERGKYPKEMPTTPLLSAMLASDLPEADRPHFQRFDTSHPRWRAYLAALPRMRNDFYTTPPGGASLCDAPVPARRKPAR